MKKMSKEIKISNTIDSRKLQYLDQIARRERYTTLQLKGYAGKNPGKEKGRKEENIMAAQP